MLIISRKPGEKFRIGDDIVITVVGNRGPQVRIGIEAPKEYRILREELYQETLEANREATQISSFGNELEGLKNLTGLSTDGLKVKGLQASSSTVKRVSGFDQLVSVAKATSIQASDVVVKRRKAEKKDD